MLAVVSHLVLQSKSLRPGMEWKFNGSGWGFLRVQSGEGYLLQSSVPRQLHEGDVLVQGEGETSLIRASQLGELHLSFFHVIPNLLLGVISLLECQQLNEHHVTLPPRIHTEHELIAQQFALLSHHHDAGENLQARCLMLHLAAATLRDVLPVRETTKPRWRSNAQDRFELLIREISSAEWQSLTIEELVRRCGCSRRHFSRMFRERFRCSLLAMQIALRVKRAQQLLAETDAKIIEIALDSGFQHVGLFVSTFKRHTGATPSLWRKRARASLLKQTAVKTRSRK